MQSVGCGWVQLTELAQVICNDKARLLITAWCYQTIKRVDGIQLDAASESALGRTIGSEAQFRIWSWDYEIDINDSDTIWGDLEHQKVMCEQSSIWPFRWNPTPRSNRLRWSQSRSNAAKRFTIEFAWIYSNFWYLTLFENLRSSFMQKWICYCVARFSRWYAD